MGERESPSGAAAAEAQWQAPLSRRSVHQWHARRFGMQGVADADSLREEKVRTPISRSS